VSWRLATRTVRCWCIACNVGIDDAVPRTQSNQVKYLIQHYDVSFVALIAPDRGFLGFAVTSVDIVRAHIQLRFASTSSTCMHPLPFKNVSFNLLTERILEIALFT
jgi:hypothetical protein